MGAPFTADETAKVRKARRDAAAWPVSDDFAPWDTSAIHVPSPQQWINAAVPRTLMLETAVRTMGRNRAALVRQAQDLGPAGQAALRKRLCETREWFEACAALLGEAESRLLVAEAVLELDGEDR